MESRSPSVPARTGAAEATAVPEDASSEQSTSEGPVPAGTRPGVAISPRLRFDLSMITLVGANLIPIFGVFFLQWDAASILILYWAENLVIGFYNVLKMALVQVPDPRWNFMKIFFIPFFCSHYGGFCFGHGLGLLAVIHLGNIDAIMKGGGGMILSTFLKPLASGGVWLVLALFVSHGVSFVQNFLRGPERRSLSLIELMVQPYLRIVVLQLVIIIGGGFAIALGSPKALLFALVLIRMILDLFLYVKTHRKGARSSALDLAPD